MIIQLYFISYFISSFLIKFSSSQDCEILLPDNPLSPQGLTTPYYSRNCDVYSKDTTVFAEAVIIDKNTLSSYYFNPLVMNYGSKNAVIYPNITFPQDYVVGIWFGSNGRPFRLNSSDTSCVDGTGEKKFKYFAYCNAREFFDFSTKLNIKPLQDECLTSRSISFMNNYEESQIYSSYFIIPGNDITIDSFSFQNEGMKIKNYNSNNYLLSEFIHPSLGCFPSILSMNIFDKVFMKYSSAFNELHAKTSGYIVQLFDPVVENDVELLNLFRIGLNQPLYGESSFDFERNEYCKNVGYEFLKFIAEKRNNLETFQSPNLYEASNLLNYMAKRFVNNWSRVSCRENCPIRLVYDYNHVVVDFYTDVQQNNINVYYIILPIAFSLILSTTCVVFVYKMKRNKIKHFNEKKLILDKIEHRIEIREDDISDHMESVSNFQKSLETERNIQKKRLQERLAEKRKQKLSDIV